MGRINNYATYRTTFVCYFYMQKSVCASTSLKWKLPYKLKYSSYMYHDNEQ